MFVTQPASPLAAPSLSAVTELFRKSDSHTKQLLIATRITTDNMFNKIHSLAVLHVYTYVMILYVFSCYSLIWADVGQGWEKWQ